MTVNSHGRGHDQRAGRGVAAFVSLAVALANSAAMAMAMAVAVALHAFSACSFYTVRHRRNTYRKTQTFT